MKVSVKASFILFWLVLLAKNALPMDLPESTLPPTIRMHSNTAIQTLCAHVNFHDLWQYSQTSQKSSKVIEDYFAGDPVVVGYFKELHYLMATTPQLDQEKAWLLAKAGATYNANIQSWILSYAINYIRDHFLTPFKQKETNPRFHQWAYIIRSFQGCDVNFKADLFINTALTRYLDRLNHIKSRDELKDNGDYDECNPKEMIKSLKIAKAFSCESLKKCFVEDQNCFWFLYLYRSHQQICLEYEYCCRLQYLTDEKLLEFDTNLLLMRHEEKQIKKILYKLIMEKDEFSWFRRTKIFLESYNGWKFTIPFEGEVKRGIEELRNSLRRRCISHCEPSRKAENEKRNRSASVA